jgi:hypothetical protein
MVLEFPELDTPADFWMDDMSRPGQVDDHNLIPSVCQQLCNFLMVLKVPALVPFTGYTRGCLNSVGFTRGRISCSRTVHSPLDCCTHSTRFESNFHQPPNDYLAALAL